MFAGEVLLGILIFVFARRMADAPVAVRPHLDLLGSLTQVVNPTSFDFSQSLFWIAVLVTAGPATLGGAILSAVLLVTVPAIFTAKAVTEWQPVAFGVMAIALAQAPNGLAGLLRLPDFPALSRGSAWRRRAKPLTRRDDG